MNKTILSLFAVLLVLSYSIEYTYKAGEFYKENLHSHVVDITKRAVALVITGSLIGYEAGKYLVEHNKEIRDKVGSYFVYESPLVTVG